MSKYITRIQLKNADLADYQQLDIEMEKELFIKVTPAGKEDQTGAREYNYRGLTTLQDVITAA